MKKIMLTMSILIMILLSACCNDKKPPHRAIYSKTSGYEMQYHIILYEPFSDGGGHSIKCGSWHYIPTHIYTDKLGSLNGTEIIWKNLDGDDFPFATGGQNSSDIHVVIQNNTIKVQGFSYKSGNDTMNGTYKIETTSPDSWGVPIVKGHPLPSQ